jgi:hypothetical protein
MHRRGPTDARPRTHVPTITTISDYELRFIRATEYAIETSVRGTGVNYQELSSVAQLPFQQKVDWLKNQFAALRTPWEVRTAACRGAVDDKPSLSVAVLR